MNEHFHEIIKAPPPNILQTTFSVHIRIVMCKKAQYHDAVYDICYFILLWKITHKWLQKARYHAAVYDIILHHLALSCFWK